MTTNFSAGTSKARWRPTKSFWITAGVWLLLLIIMLATGVSGAFGVWLVLFALFLIVTALYALLFGRRSWLGLPSRKGAGAAVGAGVVALVVGGVVAAAAGPVPSTITPLADTRAVATTTASPSPTPTPTPKSKLLTECVSDGTSFVEPGGTLKCAKNDKGVLVWMTEKDAKKLVAEQVQATKAAEEKLASDKAAAVVAEAASAEAARVAAADAAAQQAALDEAARLAAEQAAQQQAPAIQPLGEAPAPAGAYYANCDAARAAGAAPLYVGQPGYRSGMDGDNDGIACEPKR
ncbi:excalibur calcium-binding domain-containing protein [Arthrobacter glacialis]|nr:excalibur calcium-binding domain-containing protein [Arthrobacter glacialis]